MNQALKSESIRQALPVWEGAKQAHDCEFGLVVDGHVVAAGADPVTLRFVAAAMLRADHKWQIVSFPGHRGRA